jgi:hypothetical protein
LEQSIVSVPDVVAAAVNLPAYTASLIGDLSQKRAGNDNRTDATVGDFVKVAPAALAMSFLEWLGLRGGAGLEHVAASTVRDVVKQTGKEVLKEGTKGGLQADFNYWAETAGTKSGFKLGDFWDRVVEGIVGGATTSGMHHAGREGVRLARRAHGGKTPSAPATASGISDIVDAATETKLLSRNPQSFQNTVDAMAGDAGVSHVTMNGEGVAKALSQPDIDAPSIMKQMPSLAPQLVRSLLHGDPIRVPFGEYVTALAAANDNVKGALLEHVTGEPAVPVTAEGGVSIGTPDRQNATSTDRLLDDRQRQGDLSPVDAALLKSERAQDQAVEANQPDPKKSPVVTEPSAAETFKPGQVSVAPGQDPLQAIRDTATEVLKANGLRTEVAEATAAIVAIRAEDRARRLGMDPVELYNEKPLLPGGTVEKTDLGSDNRDLGQNNKVLLNLKGDELAPADSDIETLRSAAMAYYDTLRTGKPAVSPDIGNVSFVRRSKLKVKSFSGDPLKLKVLPAVRNVIEQGVYEGREQLHKERKDGIIAFHKFSGNVTLGNRLVRIEVLVAEDRNGNKHYDLFANYKNEEGDAVATRRQMRSGASPSKAGKPTYEQSIRASTDRINIRILADDDDAPAGRNFRGSVTFTDSGPIIRFFQSHDASTAIHELSHVWLEELRSDAMRPNAPQQLRDDWAEVQRYLNLGELAQDALIPTDAHETFARTGEAYFREGRAPSPQLVGILNQFRDWLRAIYRSLRQLDVEMTPEIRGVFDRLLASDEEIKTMRSPRGKGTPAPLRPPAEDAELR